MLKYKVIVDFGLMGQKTIGIVHAKDEDEAFEEGSRMVSEQGIDMEFEYEGFDVEPRK